MKRNRSKETTAVYTVSRQAQDTILVDFLAHNLKISKRKAKILLDERCVFVNERRLWMAQHRLKFNDTIEVHGLQKPKKMHIEVLYEDEHLFIVNKPSGIVTNGKDSLETLVQEKTGSSTIKAMHRLDRDTSGCLIFVKADADRERMLPLFKEHQLTKSYRTIVNGKIPTMVKNIREPVDGLTAHSDIKTITRTRKASYLHITITTGRTHQIRKHLANIHHPILGDKQYITRKLKQPEFRSIPRQMLHAYMLVFRSPFDNTIIRAKAPLPRDFTTALKLFKL